MKANEIIKLGSGTASEVTHTLKTIGNGDMRNGISNLRREAFRAGGKGKNALVATTVASVGLLVIEGAVRFAEKHPQTIGGKVCWTDLSNVNGWRLQKHKVTQHCRILDKNDVRQAHGSEAEMRRRFNSMAKR